MKGDLSPELSLLWHEAKDHVEHWDFDKAIEIYKYILIRYDDNSSATERAHACLGDILLTVGRTDEAKIHVRKAISYDPHNLRYRYLMGFIYDTRYEWENAIEQYRMALDREPNDRLYLRATGEAIFNSGDKKLGLKYLQKAMELYPNNSGILTELATAYLSLGDFESARLYAQRAVAIRPDDIMAWVVLKKAYALGNGLSHGTTS